MNLILHAIFKVTIVILCTTNLKSVICQDYDENIYRPSLAYTVDIFPDDHRTIGTCVDAFNREVNNSDSLKSVFDLSQYPGLLVAQGGYNFFETLLTSLKAEDPESIANFATRVLTQENSEDLAKKFANFFEEIAKEYEKKGVPVSRSPAFRYGLIKSLKTIGPLTVEKVLIVAIYYETEWLITAVETQDSTNLFYRCSFEADGDPN
ncbi:uncharacterized protein NPIL_666391 [Nephila pilipes]|uniref:Uncharacterized protein n=1 Tax=Nephila pilipes TaxID=299642 RepID=A0A8X6UBC6_NEPPI|nr:uncharacterized protein NPIL_666391 [Nephila pilipes]